MKKLFAWLLFALSCSAHAAGFIDGVQSTAVGGCSAAFVQKTTCTLSSNTTVCTLNGVVAGNSLVEITSYYSGNALASAPTDTQGTWSTALNPTPIAGTDVLGTSGFYQQTVAAGTHTVTTTWVSGIIAHTVLVEFSGIQATPLDQSPAAVNTTTAQANTAGPTSTTAQACEIAFAGISVLGGAGVANAAISDPPSGWTSLNVFNNTSTDIAIEQAYKILTATGAQSAAYTWTDATTAGAQSIIFTLKSN